MKQVQQSGMGKYKDLILEACLHNQVYDSQIDPSRAPWLFLMFKDSPHYNEFRDAISKQLREATDWDCVQLLHLLGQMAIAGDQVARQTLKEAVFAEANQPSEDEYLIVKEWSQLQSLGEFLDLARICGERLLENPLAFAPVGAIPEDREQEFRQALADHARAEPALQKYQSCLRERGWLEDYDGPFDREAARRERHERFRQEYPLEQVLTDAKKKQGEFPARYTAFGRHATQDELEAVYDALLEELDPEVQMRLLWVFRSVPLPAISQLVLDWAAGDHGGVRAAAIAALAQIKDEKIHQLARQKLSRAELLGADNEALLLFEKNFMESDAPLIATALRAVHPDREDAHSLGFDIIEVSRAQETPRLVEALKWAYENTPCVHCRHNTLIELEKYGGIDEPIWQELPFDADESVREFAENKGRPSMA